MKILFVCTANICRSPMAEYLLRQALDDRQVAGIDTSSAGVRALVGHPMDGSAAYAVEQLGADGSGHVARQLGAEFIRQSDLVLTADSDHRARATREVPGAMRRVFTLKEFTRLGAAVAQEAGPPRPSPVGDRFARRVADVAAQRGRVGPGAENADNIGDPFRAAPAVMQATAEEIADQIGLLCWILGLDSS
ncbi:MAG: low molecular weight phosphatase family protein [Gordonia polyisoprenivorans]|nr:low molecular weight phosphatase family protein [Gordonia polyisoprenivorans]